MSIPSYLAEDEILYFLDSDLRSDGEKPKLVEVNDVIPIDYAKTWCDKKNSKPIVGIPDYKSSLDKLKCHVVRQLQKNDTLSIDICILALYHVILSSIEGNQLQGDRKSFSIHTGSNSRTIRPLDLVDIQTSSTQVLESSLESVLDRLGPKDDLYILYWLLSLYSKKGLQKLQTTLEYTRNKWRKD